MYGYDFYWSGHCTDDKWAASDLLSVRPNQACKQSGAERKLMKPRLSPFVAALIHITGTAGPQRAPSMSCLPPASATELIGLGSLCFTLPRCLQDSDQRIREQQAWSDSWERLMLLFFTIWMFVSEAVHVNCETSGVHACINMKKDFILRSGWEKCQSKAVCITEDPLRIWTAWCCSLSRNSSCDSEELLESWINQRAGLLSLVYSPPQIC